jgi:hypothetical protein
MGLLTPKIEGAAENKDASSLKQIYTKNKAILKSFAYMGALLMGLRVATAYANRGSS